ncbi:MAG: aldehyde dehydrogenase family protein, partial [Vicinamibacterales bacterium]
MTATMLTTHRLLIDGKSVDAANGETFETVSPATNQPIATVAKAGREDVDLAVAAARR